MPNTVLVRFARKPCDINELKASLRGNDGRAYECAIEETVTLTPAEYDSFSMLLYKNCDWVEGKGGFKNDVRQVIEVTAPERETLYVDPSGYSYPRYVGLRVAATGA